MKKQVITWVVTGVLVAGIGGAFAADGDPVLSDEVTTTTLVDETPTTVVDETPTTVVDETPTTVADGSEETPTTVVDGTTDTTLEDTTETTAPADVADASANHGAVVSQAAHEPVPEGCRNRGEYVSAVARGMETNCGTAAEETTPTTEATAAAATESTPTTGHGNGKGKGHGKG